MAIVQPDRLGKYQVLAHIATGPLGDVYKARLDGIAGFRRTFAIKLVHGHLAQEQVAIQRIEEEARLAAGLAHSHIVQVLDLGRDNDRLFLVLEWVDGWSLAHVLDQARAQGTQVPLAHAVWIALQVLKALEYAHAPPDRTGGAELVHEALWTGNVLISRSGELKVADFGLARVTDVLATQDPELQAARAPHATPEHLAGQPGTTASDIFSVGVLLYECLTLQHPFLRDTPQATREAITTGLHTPVAELRPDLPASLSAAIAAALSVDPAARPASATAFKDVLSEVLLDTGEVFTQEALGTWLKGFLPEEESTSSESFTIQAELPDDLLIDDEPLRLPEFQGGEDRTAPAIDDTQLPQPEDDDMRTEVGGLGAKASENKTAPWHEGGQSVVSPEIATKLASLKTQTPAPDADQVLQATAHALGEHVLRDPEELAKGLWAGGVLAGIAALAAGIAIGVAGTFGWMANTTFVSLAPQLDVRAADGITVRIAGQPAGPGATALTPGVHTLEVQTGDQAPLKVDLTLVDGEYRVLVLERATLPSDEASGPGDEATD